jgi:G:T-mismatch repair DNA endonuclease (very short patch repair protein)
MMTLEEKRESAKLRARKRTKEQNYYIEIKCRFCENLAKIKKYAECFYKKRGGGTCKECLNRISSTTIKNFQNSQTPEERIKQAKSARACVKSENISKGVTNQWIGFRENPEKYKEICDAKSDRMKKVWENYSEKQKDFIVKSLVSSKDCGRSKVSNTLKNELIKQNLYDGFVSEEVFHGFIPDEINHKLKLIIEVFGDLYHCNPKKYKNSETYITPIQRTVGEQWKRDERKIACYKKHGYNVLIVWESDIYHHLDDEIQRIRNVILSKA